MLTTAQKAGLGTAAVLGGTGLYLVALMLLSRTTSFGEKAPARAVYAVTIRHPDGSHTTGYTTARTAQGAYRWGRAYYGRPVVRVRRREL